MGFIFRRHLELNSKHRKEYKNNIPECRATSGPQAGERAEILDLVYTMIPMWASRPASALLA